MKELRRLGMLADVDPLAEMAALNYSGWVDPLPPHVANSGASRRARGPPDAFPTPRPDGHARLRVTAPIGPTRPRPPESALLPGTRPSPARGRQFDGSTRPTRPLLPPRACR